MALNVLDLERAQDLLDEGKSYHAVSKELGTCNKTIKRYVDKGALFLHEDLILESFEKPFILYDWCDHEDSLEAVVSEAFDKSSAIFPFHITKKTSLSSYIEHTYGSLKDYFIHKDLRIIMEYVFIYCNSCSDYVSLKSWNKCKGRNFGLCGECKECTYKRVYNLSSVTNQKRLARVRSLPDSLTNEQKGQLFGFFNESCALTGENVGLHLDHVIPLSTGHAGTIFENIIPLKSDLNISKNDNNIFEWFSENKARLNLSEVRFSKLISYLADINNISVEDYREFVSWCFENPRTIEQTKLENGLFGYKKQSINIWKETKNKINY